MRINTRIIFMLMLISRPSLAVSGAEPIQKAMRDGPLVIMIRHALAPGIGDPKQFRLDDCSTQRNLSQAGRAQARRIGERLRKLGVARARIFSSQWCRCLETAKLLEMGEVKTLPALNSFFRRSEKRAAQTQALNLWLSKQTLKSPIILVTHQVNITAFSKIFPDSGEAVFMTRSKAGAWKPAGTISTDVP